jgi:hypothetical protein
MVKEFYFNDRYWTICYLAVDTGNWLTGSHVLVAMIKETRKISVNLSWVDNQVIK